VIVNAEASLVIVRANLAAARKIQEFLDQVLGPTQNAKVLIEADDRRSPVEQPVSAGHRLVCLAASGA